MIGKVVIVTMLGFVGVSSYFDVARHEEMKSELLAFMNAGGRNTAEEGWERDVRLTDLEGRVTNIEALLASGCLFKREDLDSEL